MSQPKPDTNEPKLLIDEVSPEFLEAVLSKILNHYRLKEYITTLYSDPLFLDWMRGLSSDRQATFLGQFAQKTIHSILDIPLNDLDLSVRAYNCCKENGIRTLGQLAELEAAAIIKFKNCGKKTLHELEELLKEQGLHFGTDLGAFEDPEVCRIQFEKMRPDHHYTFRTLLTRDEPWQLTRAALLRHFDYSVFSQLSAPYSAFVILDYKLKANNITETYRLIQMTPKDIDAFFATIENPMLDEVKQYLSKNGLSFGMDLKEFELPD